MKISYAITVADEADYILRNLPHILEFCSKMTGRMVDYEVVVLVDSSKEENEVLSDFYSRISKDYKDVVNVVYKNFEGDFSEHKNYLNQQCSGDWIVQLDADEFLPDAVLNLVPYIIKENPEVDAYWVPRVNTVEGLTMKHVQKWLWVITSLEEITKARQIKPDSAEYAFLKSNGFILQDLGNGYISYQEPVVNWPDPQMRIYRNISEIKWKGKIHERLVGAETVSNLPYSLDYAIRHFKFIDRQERQNELYESLS
jgi:glycosyltransferase involved in cell wall biosynthesis